MKTTIGKLTVSIVADEYSNENNTAGGVRVVVEQELGYHGLSGADLASMQRYIQMYCNKMLESVMTQQQTFGVEDGEAKILSVGRKPDVEVN